MPFHIAAVFITALLISEPSGASDFIIIDTKCVQEKLNEAGFAVGAVDGKLGSRSKKAAASLASEFSQIEFPELSAKTAETWCRLLSAEPGKTQVAIRGLKKKGPGKAITGVTRRDPLAPRKSYSYQKSPEKVRAGKQAQRFELRHGECGRNPTWNDCINDRQRVERWEHRFNSMHRLGRKVWYGWSVLFPKDFPQLSPSHSTFGQVKMLRWREPLWWISTYYSSLKVNFAAGGSCEIGKFKDLFGKWQDIVAVADYRTSVDEYTFKMWINGNLVCSRTEPLVTKKMIRKSGKSLFFKYGIYNSYVSKWLSAYATKDVKAPAFKDKHGKSGLVVKSAAKRPFKYDWGVKLPTQVVYYDEMRYGSTRSQVDLRFLEKQDIKPLD